MAGELPSKFISHSPDSVQLATLEIDHRSDVWISLGSIFDRLWIDGGSPTLFLCLQRLQAQPQSMM